MATEKAAFKQNVSDDIQSIIADAEAMKYMPVAMSVRIMARGHFMRASVIRVHNTRCAYPSRMVETLVEIFADVEEYSIYPFNRDSVLVLDAEDNPIGILSLWGTSKNEEGKDMVNWRFPLHAAIEHFDAIKDILYGGFDKPRILTIWSMATDKMGYLRYEPTQMDPEFIPTASPTHYPYLDKTPSEMLEAFMASSANVLLFIGPPGTGKSTYLREMAGTYLREDGKRQVNLVADSSLIERGGFAEMITRSLQSTRPNMTVIEDADYHLDARETGNPIMSAILNATDGIVRTNNKLIISTNLPTVKRVDPALIRPGRCFDVVTFRPLTGDEVNAVRSSHGLPPIEKANIPLAEALTIEGAGVNVPTVGFL